MNFRLTGILTLIAVFLALLILFWDRYDEQDRQRMDEARRALRFDAARVDRLVFQTGSFEVECRRRAQRWHLVRPIAARADPVAIERLLGALQELPRGDIILPPRRATDPYAPYGLDDPRARIAIIEGTTTNTILIGRRTPLGDGVYVRHADQTGLARVPATLLELLPPHVEALRDRSLLTGTAGSISRLDIRGPSGYIQLARDAGGAWRIYQPFIARADSAAIGALIEQLLSCSIVHFVQDSVGDLAPYGLDPPGAITALLGDDSGEGSQMLAFGDPLPNAPEWVYARLQAEQSVYAVPQAVRQALMVKPDDLRDRRIPGLLPDAIESLRIEEGEQILELQLNDDGHWHMTRPVRAPARPQAVESLLQSWADVRLIEFESAAPETPPVFTRTIRLQPRLSRQPPVVLRLGDIPERPEHLRIEIEGDSGTAIATPAELLKVPIQPEPYHTLDILSIPSEDVAVIEMSGNETRLRAVRDAATGLWPADAPWVERLLSALNPLRAESLVSLHPGPTPPIPSPKATLALQLRGQTGVAITLLLGEEESPGGPRLGAVHGRSLLFRLSPDTAESLWPVQAPPAP